MVKKGKKKYRAQETAVSTSDDTPSASTSGQQSSQQIQQKLQKQQQQPRQQQPPELPQQTSQSRAWGPPRPQKLSAQQQASQQTSTSRTIQQPTSRQPQPQQSTSQQGPYQSAYTQSQQQQTFQPRAWNPPRRQKFSAQQQASQQTSTSRTIQQPTSRQPLPPRITQPPQSTLQQGPYQLARTQSQQQQTFQPRARGPPRPQKFSAQQQASQQTSTSRTIQQPTSRQPLSPQITQQQSAPQQAPQQLACMQSQQQQIPRQQAPRPQQRPQQPAPQQLSHETWVQPLQYQVPEQQALHQQQPLPQQELEQSASARLSHHQTWAPCLQYTVPQKAHQQSTYVGLEQQTSISSPSTSNQDSGNVIANVTQKARMHGNDAVQTVITSSTSELSEGVSRKNISKFAPQLNENDLNIPARPNMTSGTVGEKIRVLANMFEIKFNKNFVSKAVHYDVKVVPLDIARQHAVDRTRESRIIREVRNKTLLRIIFEKCRSQHFPDRYPAYDGMANAFAAKNLPFPQIFVTEVEIFDQEREEMRKFEMTLSRAGDIDLSWIKDVKPGINPAIMNQTAIQVLDIILRHAPACRLISVGRSLFLQGNGRVETLGSGLDLHVGGYTSAVIGWKAYLNVDVSHKAFATAQSVLDVMSVLCGVNRNELTAYTVDRNRDRISNFLSGLKVNYSIPGQPSTKRTHRVNELGPNCIGYRFNVGGEMCSIEQYFSTYKNYTLQFPRLPCLWVGKRDQNTYLPAELCDIVPGQAINRKLDEKQTSTMIKFAATNTPTRIDKIMEVFNGINVNNSHVMRSEFGVSVSANMKQIDARILPAPALQYNYPTPVMVNRGVWQPKIFHAPAALEAGTWAIVNTCPVLDTDDITKFKDQLLVHGEYLGMRIGEPQTLIQIKAVPHEIEKMFIYKKNLKLLIVILPNKPDIYSRVKKISELRVGVLTQCIKMWTVKNKCNSSTLNNILLKINSKLNGINHTFTPNTMPHCLRNTKYMIIGADVSHPSPDARDIPSVAAVAASHDETTFKYNVTIRLQQPRQEEIADLKEIMLKHLAFYHNAMNYTPERIIFYRDGVSEGQIAMVLSKEIRSIKEACREYARKEPDFQPELTFVIVQKRHHVRIFPKNKEDSDDRNFNVKAGTIVDTEITHPNHIDFYLVSHASIQGTARPTKYRCICNESNFNVDQLEELTYHLCHMYARCTRSVSYPAPTYYAHLAAYRGRTWIQGNRYTEADLQNQNNCRLESKVLLPMSFV